MANPAGSATRSSRHPGRAACYKDILHLRNYSPYTARDFDISPYFQIIKPERPADFDYRALHWDE